MLFNFYTTHTYTLGTQKSKTVTHNLRRYCPFLPNLRQQLEHSGMVGGRTLGVIQRVFERVRSSHRKEDGLEQVGGGSGSDSNKAKYQESLS